MELPLHPKQLKFINSQATEVFFGGAAGGGKSYVLRADAIIWCMNVPGIQVYLFRRLYKDLLRSHMAGPSSFPMLLREFIEDKLVRINYSANEIIFSNHSKIVLAHIQHESDLENYLSQEINIALFDEGSTFTEKMYRFIRSRVRIGGLHIPAEFKGRLPRIGIASNPRGPMHSYLKNGWVDASLPETVFTAKTLDGGMTREYIPSKIDDNPTLVNNDPNYKSRLMGLGDPDVVLAYLEGDWNAVEGAALGMWDAATHIIPAFNIPFSWKIKRGYDYGYSAPYSVLWIAISNGESYMNHEGDECTMPKGSIIFIEELYGDDGQEHGLKEDVRLTAQKIKMLETMQLSGKRITKGPADNSIFNKEQGPSIANIMGDEGITWGRSNKNPGSRVLGLTQIRQMLTESTKEIPERPCMYFFQGRVPRLISHLPLLSVDDKTGEDVETSGQPDHDYDVVRYLVLDTGSYVSIVNVEGV
jgi:hypothetical protein